MSLIGSELALELDFNALAEESNGDSKADEGNDHQAIYETRTPPLSNRRRPQTNVTTSVTAKNRQTFNDDDDGHEPPTPQSGMENFFLGGLPTENVSAAALAEELHQRSSPSKGGASSWFTDDFRTAHTHQSDSLHFPTTEDDEVEDSIFSKDALLYSGDAATTSSDEPETTSKTTQRSIMSTPVSTPVKKAPPAEEVDEPLHVDPAEKVYDTAKNVWGWGKSVFIFKPFMGIAEGIAGKVVETAGSSFEDIDSALTGKFQSLDDGILNPAIKQVVKIALGAAGKTEEIFKPIVMILLKPIDFMIKSKPEEESSTPAPPEVTPAMN